MKKLLVYTVFVLCAGCTMPGSVSIVDSRPPFQGDNTDVPMPVPSPISDLDRLKAGVLPDPSLSGEEQKLAGFLERKPNPSFPLKVGLVLYRNNSLLNQNTREELFEKFKQELSNNQNISQVVEIPSSLMGSNTTIEDIRNIGARFQVSTILVLNDSYQSAVENKNAVVTPIDIISGIRTWDSYSEVEVFALDVLNGVVVFSVSATAKESDRFSTETQKAKNETIIKSGAEKVWNLTEDKITAEIEGYKSRVNSN